jgi:hypothetical protein
VNLDVRLGVEFLGTEPALEAVGRHLVGLVHVGLQLGSRIFLNRREESLKSTRMHFGTDPDPRMIRILPFLQWLTRFEQKLCIFFKVVLLITF